MKQFIRYVLVGVFNTVFGYCIIFACMYLLGLGAELSNAIGYAVGLLVSYTLNRHFTFASKHRRTTEFARFLLVFGIAYALNFAVLLVLLHGLHVHAGVSQVLAGIVYVGASYLMNKFWVFRGRSAS